MPDGNCSKCNAVFKVIDASGIFYQAKRNMTDNKFDEARKQFNEAIDMGLPAKLQRQANILLNALDETDDSPQAKHGCVNKAGVWGELRQQREVLEGRDAAARVDSELVLRLETRIKAVESRLSILEDTLITKQTAGPP